MACHKSWSAFAKSTFECGRRDLIALREEWVRDTTRAWSGQVRAWRQHTFSPLLCITCRPCLPFFWAVGTFLPAPSFDVVGVA